MDIRELRRDIVEWVRQTVGDSNIIIGISGGKDSTICAMIAKLAVGTDRVYGVKMPCGIQKDISDSDKVCDLLRITNYTINIGKTYAELSGEIMSQVEKVINPVYSSNTPARLRMTTLYGVGAIIGNCRVCNTCNKSEDYVGYSTKFGDSAGDFSPLADLTVQEVLELGEECARELGIYDEMKDLIFKTPNDGMCGKSDEDNLGFTYAVLDKYLLTGECEALCIREKIEKMHAANLHKITPMPYYHKK